jgi:hypothetical protein
VAANLSQFEPLLGLPEGFVARQRPEGSIKVESVLALRSHYSRRRYLLGVLIAYVAVVEELLTGLEIDSLEEALEAHPPLTEAHGKRLNSLTFEIDGGVISLRKYYNLAERVIRHELHRLDYPNAAPHATQSWSQHQREFNIIASMTPGERAMLMDSLWEEVVALPESPGQAGAPRETRPFEKILAEFPAGQPGEPPGAVLQGLAYAYYRADSPNVTLRIYKVGSGSSRVGAAGDVDGWIGDTLALSVEVKDLDIGEDGLSQFDQFMKQLERWPNCTAVALARSFSPTATEWLNNRGILPFDRPRMASNVSYWDVPKQKMAVREFLYFLAVVQSHHKLLTRFRQFCDEKGISVGEGAG